jgi:hypothetical protein
VAERSNGKSAARREWVSVGWQIFIAIVIASAGVGTLLGTISGVQTAVGGDATKIEKLQLADRENQKALSAAVEDRNRLLSELERRIMDRNDATNEKIASATATNQATRDMLMMLERRLEVLEGERRNTK